jgi:hypothetical protein
MTEWQDLGFDRFGHHLYRRTFGHMWCGVSSGPMGTYTFIRNGGWLHHPLGSGPRDTPIEACRFLDRIMALVMAAPPGARDRLLARSGNEYLLPLGAA